MWSLNNPVFAMTLNHGTALAAFGKRDLVNGVLTASLFMVTRYECQIRQLWMIVTLVVGALESFPAFPGSTSRSHCSRS